MYVLIQSGQDSSADFLTVKELQYSVQALIAFLRGLLPEFLALIPVEC